MLQWASEGLFKIFENCVNKYKNEYIIFCKVNTILKIKTLLTTI